MSPVTLKTALVRAPTVMAGARTGRPGRRHLVPLALLLAAPLALAGCGTAAKPAASPAATFGGYPSYLPKDTLNYHSDTVLTGTAQRPAGYDEPRGRGTSGRGRAVRARHHSDPHTMSSRRAVSRAVPVPRAAPPTISVK
jgi:hypothetical protein